MTEDLHPATSDAAEPVRTPRALTPEEMLKHIDNGAAVPLNPGRHDMFLRYDGSWWIGDAIGFTEITSPEQNARVDRWHQRLSDGALWS
jgi:hypothetical protein